MQLDASLTTVKGVGEKTKELFEKIGVYTVRDILLRFPRTYVTFPSFQDLNQLNNIPQEKVALLANVATTPQVKKTRNKNFSITTTMIGDSGHRVEVVWFRAPYIKSQLQTGKHYVFYGTITVNNGHYVLEHPDFYDIEVYEKLTKGYHPIYALTAKLTNHMVQKTIRTIYQENIAFDDYLPVDYKERFQLLELNDAIKKMHFPDTFDELSQARKRIVFDEFFGFLLEVQATKEKKLKTKNTFIIDKDHFGDTLLSSLPYELTNAQKKVIKEIKQDMKNEYVMQRLVQGDVGSGKTIVAFLAMLLASENGYQSAIMAPTEVLAAQHYESFTKFCEENHFSIPIIFLSGSMTKTQKKQAYNKIETNSNAIIVGTHALIQEKVIYNKLALVITDEQHRFGVVQRDVLSQKGEFPHVLIMSATPIPRTLSHILYGDMDVSVIDEVPATRTPIKNCVVPVSYRPKAYEFMKEEINKGHQVYIICPLVEESESSEGEDVISYTDKIREFFSDEINIEYLHGKMKNVQKDEIMNRFHDNKIQILVSTTVVEVGVNVPNATIMMIENANRFGLAQLHQLRGRVGRGDAQSYCIMINSSNSKNAKKRLEILNHSNDGFYIASEDLKLRGPGDIYGIRQSGMESFEIADIYQDADILQMASTAVKEILENDPELSCEDNHKIYDLLMERRKKSYIDVL